MIRLRQDAWHKSVSPSRSRWAYPSEELTDCPGSVLVTLLHKVVPALVLEVGCKNSLSVHVGSVGQCEAHFHRRQSTG